MIKQVTKDEVRLLIRARTHLKVVDVLSREHYQQGHLPGALSLPLNEIDENAKDMLDHNDLIIVYCANYECTASTRAAEKLLRLGYKHVLDYKGGFADYTEDGVLDPEEQVETSELFV
jgi:rhodanese-related sulfurtransferase